ncbi:MAG: HNH endonuclease [Planctomycetes bacterium]|nr:HNH endonuclease [Planctomycetota bacterium]
MPMRPKRPCGYPLCRALVDSGPYCPEHKRKAQREYDRRRGPEHRFYNSTPWRRFRRWFLSRHPLCVECDGPANTVDHIEPRRERPDLELAESNCRALCASCHSRRHARDGSRWGIGPVNLRSA